MAFSYDPDGGIAVARILSDHPDDNGKIVYLHRQYEPAPDDAWYDNPDNIPAALPPGLAAPANSNFQEHELDQKHGAGETKPARQRPQTTPASAGHTTFTTQEVPDTDFPFAAATVGASSHKGRALLRGGAFVDEKGAPDGKDDKPAAGAAGAAAGAGADTVAQLGALSGPGAGAGTPSPAPLRSALKRPRQQQHKSIQFDPLPAKDQHGNAVAPRRADRQRAREQPAGPGYPMPAKDPDSMSDAEFDAWAQSLSEQQWDSFCDHMEDMEDDSDAEDSDDSVEDMTPPPKRARTQQTATSAGAGSGWTDLMPAELPRRPPAPPPRPLPVPAATMPSDSSPLSLLGGDFFQRGSKEKNKMNERDVKMMAAQLAYGPHHTPNYTGPKAATMRKIHEEAREAMTRRQMGKEIELFGGDCFRLIPSWPKRECLFIVGQQGAGWSERAGTGIGAVTSFDILSGEPHSHITPWDVLDFDTLWRSGKSWFAGRYIREWKKQHPDGKVVVFSQVPDDKELDKCGITRVMIDDGLVENPYEIKELNNCLVLFDDIDAIRDKKLKKVVTELCDELQVIGRHENTWVLRTSHLFRNWGTTRASLAESNKTVFFPQLGSSYGIKSWLKTHVGLDPKKIERMFKLRSRWVVLDQHAPNWVLSEHLLYIL